MNIRKRKLEKVNVNVWHVLQELRGIAGRMLKPNFSLYE